MDLSLRGGYMNDYEAKEAILEIGRRMYNRGFVAANDGNITCRVGENEIWTTPTGVSKGFMTSDMLVKVNLEGAVLSGSLKPSSELKMHLRVFRENPAIQGVTHAHPPVATAFSIAGRGLDKAILTEGVLSLGEIPLAPYATPGTEEVPDSIAAFVNTHNGALLANHGALSWGRDVFEAWYRLESMECYATILMYTDSIIKKQNVLNCEQVNRLIDIRTRNGIHSGGALTCADCPVTAAGVRKKDCACREKETADITGGEIVTAKILEEVVQKVMAKLGGS